MLHPEAYQRLEDASTIKRQDEVSTIKGQALLKPNFTQKD